MSRWGGGGGACEWCVGGWVGGGAQLAVHATVTNLEEGGEVGLQPNQAVEGAGMLAQGCLCLQHAVRRPSPMQPALDSGIVRLIETCTRLARTFPWRIPDMVLYCGAAPPPPPHPHPTPPHLHTHLCGNVAVQATQQKAPSRIIPKHLCLLPPPPLGVRLCHGCKGVGVGGSLRHRGRCGWNGGREGGGGGRHTFTPPPRHVQVRQTDGTTRSFQA